MRAHQDIADRQKLNALSLRHETREFDAAFQLAFRNLSAHHRHAVPVANDQKPRIDSRDIRVLAEQTIESFDQYLDAMPIAETSDKPDDGRSARNAQMPPARFAGQMRPDGIRIYAIGHHENARGIIPTFDQLVSQYIADNDNQ